MTSIYTSYQHKPIETYLWSIPTTCVEALTIALSQELGIPRHYIREGILRDVLRVVGDWNARVSCYPIVSEEMSFNTPLLKKQWLLGSRFVEPYRDFVEGMRDDLHALGRHQRSIVGLYTTMEHLKHCAGTSAYALPIIRDSDMHHCLRYTESPEIRTPDDGFVLSQGNSLILPELALDLLLPEWVDNEPVYIHMLPIGMRLESLRFK